MKKFFLIFFVITSSLSGEESRNMSWSWGGSYNNYSYRQKCSTSEWSIFSRGGVGEDRRVNAKLSDVAYALFGGDTPPSQRALGKVLGGLSELEAMQFVASTGSITGFELYEHQRGSTYSQDEVLTNIWMYVNGVEIRPTGSCGDRAWFVAKALGGRGIKTGMNVFHIPGGSHVIDIAWAPSLGQFALIDWGKLTLTGTGSYKRACEAYETLQGIITPEVYTFVGSKLFIQQTEMGLRMNRAWGLDPKNLVERYEFNRGATPHSSFEIFSGSEGYSLSWNRQKKSDDGYGGTTIKAGIINPTSSALKSGIPYVLSEIRGYKGTNPFEGVCLSGKLAIGFAYVPNREDPRNMIPADVQLVWGHPVLEGLAVLAGGQFSLDLYVLGDILKQGGVSESNRAPMLGRLSAFTGVAARYRSLQVFLTAGVRKYFENVSNLNMFWAHWDFVRGSLVHTRKHVQVKATVDVRPNYWSVGGALEASFKGLAVSLEGERRTSTVGAFSPNSWIGKVQVSANLTDFLKLSVKGEYEGKQHKIGSEETWTLGMNAEVTF